VSSGATSFDALPETSEETVEEASKRIAVRYEAMERMGGKIVAGKLPSLIISGPPGMEKSWTIDHEISKSGRRRHDGETDITEVEDHEGAEWFDKISGNCSSVGLYHSLWHMRNGGLVYLDDCDAVFRDDDALNLLKIATDSTKERLVSWRKNSAWLEEYGIDKTFDFQGHIVFLTNIDFEKVIERGHKDSEHFKALIDRASYLCLTLRTRRDFMLRIRTRCDGPDGILMKAYGLDLKQTKTVLDYVDEHQTRFYNLSIRLVCQIAILMKADSTGWRDDIEATKMRTT
jgi:hypothetical protein